MEILWWIFCAVALSFCFVVFFGAPLVPTRRKWAEQALKLAEIKPGETVVDLGSGTGIILELAVKSGARAIGYELSPLLVLFSKLKLLKYKHAAQVKIGNFWRQDLPKETNVVYVFAVTRDAEKLNKYLSYQAKKLNCRRLRVVAFGFSIPYKKPVKRSAGANLYYF